ncbi:guanylate kinase [Vibrio sp. 947]|uniref:Guanylate kinase n=1 Tax=Vibrio vulnificus TaxID=672 RepID=A0AAN1UF41_VIBVL|nr:MULTISPECIES: guanylate kinase [Vibrio]EJG0766797.1 guanylate kinase [Vibrio parahaemolyticus O5:K30]MCA2474819.1 hypothetical protein [Vibrio alginolyticus]MDG2756915.1 guanylate kinase [Vibrio parahaemolyticus]TVN04602.1 guanylate kinase [Vibrio cholerae]AXX63160.1 Guanylate kinase [Vibrio vulnificus]
MNKLLIIAGRTASGKDALATRLIQEFGFQKCITTTTREPRPYEKDGVHYHFLSKHEFLYKVESGEFLEHEVNKGNYYGSTLSAVIESLKQANTCLILDPRGAVNAKAKLKENGISSVVLYVNESIDTCKSRLLGRTESESAIQEGMRSLESDEKDWDTAFSYDIVTKPLDTIDNNAKLALSVI